MALYQQRFSRMADASLTLIVVSVLISILTRIRLATVPLAMAAILACYAAYATADRIGDVMDGTEG